MGGYHNFYEGASKYGGGGQGYGDPDVGMAGQVSATEIGLAIDARSANQLGEVSRVLNTGAKTIEVQGTFPNVLEAMPAHHMDEIRRLKDLTGVDLTFHGPLVEASGIDMRNQRWDELEQKKAEKQAFSAVQRGQRLNPDGNTVITFHTTNGPPEAETTMLGDKTAKILWVHNQLTNQINQIPPQADHLAGKDNPDPKLHLKEINRDQWEQSLSNASLHAYRGQNEMSGILDNLKKLSADKDLDMKTVFEFYKKAGTPEGEKLENDFVDKIKKDHPKIDARKEIRKFLSEVNYTEMNVREAYSQMQQLFNRAWATTKKGSEDHKKLNEFRDHMAPLIEGEGVRDVEKIEQFSEEVARGMRMLSTLNEPPEIYKPLQGFMMDKTSETFSNVAFQSFKEFGENSPIISLENPPAGQAISKGEEIKDLVEATRKKFVEQVMNDEKLKLSEEEATKQADKLIGVTWDVGHINMLRRYGYEEKDLLKETEHVADMVKHVHLSDNFGLEHTELPMGMGNVPTKKHLDLISGFNKQAKKIVETGGPWFQFFQRSPLVDTFASFGVSAYGGGQGGPDWSQTRNSSGSYFSGYGMNPEVHHSLYGAGFGNIPVELGGQMAGRNRLSGSPME